MIEITSNRGRKASAWKSIPGFAKIIILLQTAIIFFLSFWIYQEYLNNLYLQTYVNGFLQGSFLEVIILISIGSFATVAIALYAKLRGTRKEIEGILSRETIGPYDGPLGQPLDNRTEQHLIEMIRKTTPILNSGPATGGRMPSLGRKDYQSSGEEQRSNK